MRMASSKQGQIPLWEWPNLGQGVASCWARGGQWPKYAWAMALSGPLGPHSATIPEDSWTPLNMSNKSLQGIWGVNPTLSEHWKKPNCYGNSMLCFYGWDHGLPRPNPKIPEFSSLIWQKPVAEKNPEIPEFSSLICHMQKKSSLIFYTQNPH